MTTEKQQSLHVLPTLDEVLQRKTRPPVCLYNYYIVLRDRLELEILLDFWLDVQQANVLYRRYHKHKNKQQQVDHHVTTPTTPTTIAPSSLKDTYLLTHMLLSAQTPRPSMATTSSACSVHKRAPPPTQADMMDVVERIFLRYFVPSAEKELHLLPDSMREGVLRDFKPTENPAIFNEPKDYVHHLLQSTFPLFLRYKVLMNMTLHQQIGRIACGLFGLLVGFSLEFSLIFLNIQPWQKRLWGIFPIAFGVFCLVTGLAGLDPTWVLCFHVSETTTFRFNTICQPYVKDILVSRSIVVLTIIFLLSAILLVVFCNLPGKRL
ncbi:Bud site selection protein, Revert to axial protein 1 [Apophysomyces ossiformis]|uniref:Bud site selection protein, Revert to axial protein 1 n=1 Tax=Apophysomyces ossiformis TaxID=679940 RepID=A0A8H7BXJ2_9FUNG|nr:Bud site selection protein, Revert to axial protein 1 [Apophysomyces ossiformis]